MRYLTREYWKSFEKPDGKFDGIKFERLVSKLLPTLYPGEWLPTQYSWDGKKDFYQQKGEERRWAECKAYKEPISINVISPTLIMALLDDAHVILIFSYSRLNKNARWYLGQFASLTSRAIHVYDDETLEHLILTNSDLRNEFFPTISVTDLPPLVKVVAHARLSQDPDVEYDADNAVEQDQRDIYLSLLSTFTVDILVRNYSVNAAPVSGRIVLNKDDLVSSFWLFSQEPSPSDPVVRFTVGPGQAFFHRFYFRARRTGRLNAPRVFLEIDGQAPEELQLDTIEVSSILAVPLIGERQHAALASFRHSVSARDKPVFFHLHGQSGTGKSRLLREFRDELLKRGFLVFMFNGEGERNSSFDHFVKRLASRISKLPMLDQVVRPTAADTGFASAGSDPTLLDLLYCDTFRPSQNRDASIRVILDLLATRKAAVLVDNMQFLDADTIALFNAAVTETEGAAARNVWVLGLNTDVMTSELPAASLSSRLRSLAADNPGSVFSVQVEGFTERDALHYLDEALAGGPSDARGESFTVSHPQTAALIIERVGTRPLFLEQALQYAADLGGLGLRAGRLYITDIEQFHAAIDGLPSRIRELIAKRWDFISRRLRPGPKVLVRSLTELISMPMSIAQQLGVTRDDVYALISLGIVDITESNEVRFHHRQHYLYFVELYRELEPSFARGLLEAIDAAGYAGAYPFQDIRLRETMAQLREDDVRKIAAVIIDNIVVGAARQRTVPLLLEIFNRPNITVDPGTELRVVSSLCQDLKRHETLEAAARAYDNARAVRVTRVARYLNYGEAYNEFVRNHVNSFFALRRDGEALPLLQSSLDALPKFRFEDERAQRFARGKLLNRLCVALRAVNDLESAERSVRESLAIAQEILDPRLTYKNYVDWGYIYHGLGRHNDELIRKWGAALDVFRKHVETDAALSDERPSVFHHSGALEILAHRRGEAVRIIEEGIRYNQRALSPFHEVKLLLLRVIAELAWGTGNADPKSLKRWVEMAEDRAITARALRSYWVVFYVRAKLHLMTNEHEKALESFLVALEQLRKVLTDPRMEERHEPFFEDFALNMRLYGRVPSEQEMRWIRNARVRRNVETIVTMAESAFSDWLGAYRPTATYHDGRYNLPMP